MKSSIGFITKLSLVKGIYYIIISLLEILSTIIYSYRILVIFIISEVVYYRG